jgi:hypothetical protein
MKLSAVLSITAIAQVSLAEFYLFRVETGGDSGYQISDVYNPQCEELGNKTPWYPAKSDVSGRNLGITCSGNGCWGDQVRRAPIQAHRKVCLTYTTGFITDRQDGDALQQQPALYLE